MEVDELDEDGFDDEVPADILSCRAFARASLSAWAQLWSSANR
jgi:hypothetical protein